MTLYLIYKKSCRKSMFCVKKPEKFVGANFVIICQKTIDKMQKFRYNIIIGNK